MAAELDPLPLDPRDSDIVRAKKLARRQPFLRARREHPEGQS